MSISETTGDGESEVRRARIQQWLMEEGWQIGLRTLPDTLWALVCNDPQKRHITIVQEAGRKDRIIMAAGLKVAPEHQSRISQLPEKERHNLIVELRQYIILLDVGFAGIQDPLQLIIFDQRIYDDGLTKDAFLQRITKVRNAGILAANIISRYLSEPPPPSPEEKRIGYPTH